MTDGRNQFPNIDITTDSGQAQTNAALPSPESGLAKVHEHDIAFSKPMGIASEGIGPGGIGMILLYILVGMVLVVVFGYISSKGMCKLMQHNKGHPKGIGLHILNAITGGLMGICAHVIMKDTCTVEVARSGPHGGEAGEAA